MRLDELKVGDLFQTPEIPAYRHATLKLWHTGPSQNKEGHRRVVVKFKAGRSSKHTILTLPDDMEVTVVTSPPKPTPPAQAPKPKCTCTNHMGTRKQKYHSQADAVAAILKRHLHHGGHSVYRCPREEGIFHVRSQKMRLDP